MRFYFYKVFINFKMTGIKIVTERIQLRLIDVSDLESIHKLHSLPETDKYNALGIPKNSERNNKLHVCN